ncbi:hypothetical protein [Sphingomonas oryzagri]
MTILLVLGLFAGLYIFWLAITLAVHALPLYVGLATGFWLHSHGHGYLASILGGFLAGVLTLSAGRLLFDVTRSPALRLVIALLFVLPAGFAGYQAIHGIAGLALGAGMPLTILSAVGACIIAGMAWLQLASAQTSAAGTTHDVDRGVTNGATG